uniref:Uncharacterized protein n=1 Tax=Octopus bimaculoides TaxID=37653 RepID=A0A0L8FT61_OCTBM
MIFQKFLSHKKVSLIKTYLYDYKKKIIIFNRNEIKYVKNSKYFRPRLPPRLFNNDTTA